MTGGVEAGRRLVGGANAITVLTGAGISTDSGVPDYRGPNGVWTKNPAAERLSSYHDYVADPLVRQQAWQTRLRHPAWTAQPNAGHAALVQLEKAGRLVALLTQNIDGLHQQAGSSPARVVELHGTMWWAVCLTCGDRTPMQDELARVEAGESDPACIAAGRGSGGKETGRGSGGKETGRGSGGQSTLCGGILKSATISFGQSLEPVVVERAVAAAGACDLFIAVGSSLTVQPAAGLCEVAVAAGSPLVVINAEPTPYDEIATLVLRQPIGEILPELVRDIGGDG